MIETPFHFISDHLIGTPQINLQINHEMKYFSIKFVLIQELKRRFSVDSENEHIYPSNLTFHFCDVNISTKIIIIKITLHVLFVLLFTCSIAKVGMKVENCGCGTFQRTTTCHYMNDDNTFGDAVPTDSDNYTCGCSPVALLIKSTKVSKMCLR